MKQEKVVRLEVEYEDGEVRRADGDDADCIWTDLMTSQYIRLVRQRRTYEGPSLQVVRGASPLSFESVDDSRVRSTLSELAREELDDEERDP